MAKREKEPKTELGRRFRAVRRALGDEERKLFAASLGYAVNTIASYEHGEAEPPASVFLIYHDRFGVSANWLVTGKGEMFDDPDHVPTSMRSVDASLMKRLGRIVVKAHKAVGLRLPDEAIAEQAAELYNDLQGKVANWSDADEIEACIPQVELRLKRRLEEAAASPGTGKRAAS